MAITAAATRRYAAIKTVCTRYLDQATGNLLADADRASIAADIREMATLGRADRWKTGVEGWARLVEAEDAASLGWAVTQGAIWVGHEAE